METNSQKLSAQQVLDAGLADWRQLVRALWARWEADGLSGGAEFVSRVAAVADELNHHPEVSLGYGYVELRATSHDVGGITERDVDLARRVSALAAELGLRPRPDLLREVELGLDAAQPERLGGPYAALLGTEEADGEVHDPDGRRPTIWFQEPDPAFVPAAGEPPQRWHLDVWVPVEEGPARVEAFVAAGGRVVDDSEAPSFWVLADADGNRSCVCTVDGR